MPNIVEEFSIPKHERIKTAAVRGPCLVCKSPVYDFEAYIPFAEDVAHFDCLCHRPKPTQLPLFSFSNAE